jgi:hypothetical protein
MKCVVRLMLVLLAAIPLGAGAQQRELRQGTGFSYGPALVAGSIHCDTCSDDFAGAGGYLRLGRYLRPDLFLAVEANLHTLPLAYTRWDTQSVSAVVQWYPAVDNGFYLKGGLGVARLAEVDNEDDATQRRTLTAPALGISVGYDIRTRRRFLLSPFASAMYLTSADYKNNGRVTRSASARTFQIGLGFTWY